MAAAVIDLGEPGSAPPRRPRRRFDPASVRDVALAAVIVLCAATLSASARPRPDLIDPGWTVGIGRNSVVKMTARTVFVLSSDGGARITAYELADGTVRWSRPVPVSRLRLDAAEPGVVLVPVGRTSIRYVNDLGQAIISGLTEATVALDPRTGAERWRQPGEVVHSTPETAFLVQPGATVRQVRTADGAVLWSRSVPGAESWLVAGHELRSARIIAVTADGRVVVLRLADGTDVSRGDVPADEVGADAMVYANRTVGGRAMVTAYDLDSLHPQWAVTGASAAARTHPCGTVLCFADSGGIAGLDPGRGTLRWRAPGWTDATPVTGENRLIAGNGGRHAILDSSTGAVLADLGPGTPVWDAGDDGPVFYLRPSGAGRMAVSRIDVRSGDLRPRGLVERAGGSGCGAVADQLVCATAGGRLAVTTVG